MAIRAPGARLLADSPFTFLRHGRGGRKSVDSQITLIPFIDFLMTVVVFLLMSFSASGEAIPYTSNLPSAANATPLEIAPVVSVDGANVTVDGRRVADTTTLASSARLERIDPLVQDLEVQRANWPVLHPRDDFAGRVIVQASRDVDFRVLRKVLFSVGQAGYANVQLAVRDAS